MKLKCSGQSCNHVYEYTDTEYYLCNDPGEVVFRCPECKALTKAEVHNVDHYRYSAAITWRLSMSACMSLHIIMRSLCLKRP